VSNKAITWAYAQQGPDLKPGAKFILVTIADMADQAHSCYPGIPLLAEMTGISDSAIRAHLKLLVETGYLTVERRHRSNGSRSTNRYYLPVDNSALTPDSGSRTEPSKRQIQADLTPDSGGDINPHLTKNNESPTQVTTEPVDNSAGLTAIDEIESPVKLTWRGQRILRRQAKALDLPRVNSAVAGMFPEFDPRERLNALRVIAWGILGIPASAGNEVSDPTAYVIASIKAEPEVHRKVAFALEEK